MRVVPDWFMGDSGAENETSIGLKKGENKTKI
jgi:hypothetical protein